MDACVSLRWDVLLARLPFFHLPYASDINIALEFDASWVTGLGKMSKKEVRKLLREPSQRGLAMRAHWAWRMGEIARWARLWLIDRGGGLPDNYKLPSEGLKHDGRYDHDTIYNKYPCKSERHYFFIDGRNRYVESNSWESQRCWEDFHHCVHSVPVLEFIWTVRWLCHPSPKELRYHYLNEIDNDEHFFRVLCPVPGTDGTG